MSGEPVFDYAALSARVDTAYSRLDTAEAAIGALLTDAEALGYYTVGRGGLTSVQQALDAARDESDGGLVVVPRDVWDLTASVIVHGRTHFHIEEGAGLRIQANPGGTRPSKVVVLDDPNDVTISGPGYVDGNQQNFDTYSDSLGASVAVPAGSKNVKVLGLEVRNPFRNGIAQSSDLKQYSEDLWVERCYVHDGRQDDAGGGVGIFVGVIHGGKVNFNKIRNMSDQCIGFVSPYGTAPFADNASTTALLVRHDFPDPGPWTDNMWVGFTVQITEGTGDGQSRVIASNTNNTITPTVPFTTAADATSRFQIIDPDHFCRGYECIGNDLEGPASANAGAWLRLNGVGWVALGNRGKDAHGNATSDTGHYAIEIQPSNNDYVGHHPTDFEFGDFVGDGITVGALHCTGTGDIHDVRVRFAPVCYGEGVGISRGVAIMPADEGILRLSRIDVINPAKDGLRFQPTGVIKHTILDDITVWGAGQNGHRLVPAAGAVLLHGSELRAFDCVGDGAKISSASVAEQLILEHGYFEGNGGWGINVEGGTFTRPPEIHENRMPGNTLGEITSGIDIDLFHRGHGVPTVRAAPPSIWLNKDGAAGTVLYYKSSAGSGAGWVAGLNSLPLVELMLQAEGFVAQNFDRQLAGNTTTLTSGIEYVMLIPVRGGVPFSRVFTGLVTAGTAAGTTHAFVVVRDLAFNILARSADLVATPPWEGSTGPRASTLTLDGAGNPLASYTPAADGCLYVSLLWTGTGAPALARQGNNSPVNNRISANAYPAWQQTGLLAPANPGVPAISGPCFWVGLAT